MSSGHNRLNHVPCTVRGRPSDFDGLAVSQDGQTILGSSMDEVAHRAAQAFGHGIFLYKVGERAVGRWR